MCLSPKLNLHFKLFLPIFLLLVGINSNLHSQEFFPVRDFWRQCKWELMLGLGTANYYGDVGGADGSEAFALVHLEPKNFRSNIQTGLRYNFHKNFSVSGNLAYLNVSGDDADTKYELRNARNLSFSTDVVELTGKFEYHLIRPKVGQFGRVKWGDFAKFKMWDVVLFAGAGTFYYNPKARIDGDLVPLRPLSTEGQGLDGGPKPYSRFAIAFPVGLSLSYYLGFKTMIGFDLNYRIITTDYLDDVSGFYYSPDKIRDARGDVAAQLSNRALESADPNWSVPGAIRGNPENDDTFFSVSFTITTSIINNKELGRKIKGMKRRRKPGPIAM